MIKKRAILLLVFSLILTGVAIWGATLWMNRQVEKRTVRPSLKIVVASANVAAGAHLAPGLLMVVDWSGTPIAGSFSDVQPLADRVVLVNLTAGEPVLEQKLAPLGSKAGLSAMIPAGMRAVSVRVNDVAGVSGFALPGNHVDVMVSIQDDQGKMVSKIVLQQILVLAVAQDASVKDDTKARVVNSVTLEVTPQQAEALDLARSVGTLSLALRNQVDQGRVVTAGVRKADLLGGAPPPSPASVAEPVHIPHANSPTVEIIRGTVHSETSSR